PMNNYWHTNYQAGQGGVFTFRYVLTSSGQFAPAEFSKLGWESMEPVELNRVIPPDKNGNPPAPLPAEGTSLLQVNGEGVVLADWKLSEDGVGTIVRLAETGGKRTEATIHVPRGVLRAAALCSAVEDNRQSLDVQSNSVHVTLNPHEVVTVRLKIDQVK
ncbi:MAG TPA: glycosyl hydrolase-related protein, partial [Terracidiphilus sp.]